MSYEFKFPDIGEGLTEGEIVRWLVKEGDEVKEGQPLVEVETDKALAEIPSPRTGVVLKILAKGLLLSSIRDPDPVIFLEPKRIYRAIREEVPEGDSAIPLGKARLVKEGKDVTLFVWGAMVREVLNAVEQLSGDKIDAEVIDLRTLSPLDVDAIIGSIRKTGRGVVVHEAPKTCGPGAEIIALINEKALLSLQAPIERVTGFDIPVPLSKSERYYLPNPKRIVMAVRKVMNF